MSALAQMLEPLVINQSGMKDYLDCRRLYGWRRLQGLEPEMRRSALEIGTAVHAALAVFHSPKPEEEALAYLAPPPAAEVPDEVVKKAAEEHEKQQAALPKAAEGIPVLEHKANVAIHTAATMLNKRSGIQSAFEDKTLAEADEITRRTLEGYFKHWGGKRQLWKPLGQEVQFLVEVQPGWWETTFGGGSTTAIAGDAWDAETGRKLQAEWERLPKSGIWLRGRADNLALVPGIGLYDVDYKTAARLDPRDMLKYELDMQLTFYIYAITKSLTMQAVAEGKPPLTLRGAVIDLLVKTKTPQYAREIFTRTGDELAEFEREIVEYGSELRLRRQRVRAGADWKVVFGKNTQHCYRYGTCPFREVCLKDTPVRRMLYAKRKLDYVDEAQAELNKEWLKSLEIPCEHCGGRDIPGGNLCSACGKVTGVECQEAACGCHTLLSGR